MLPSMVRTNTVVRDMTLVTTSWPDTVNFAEVGFPEQIMPRTWFPTPQESEVDGQSHPLVQRLAQQFVLELEPLSEDS